MKTIKKWIQFEWYYVLEHITSDYQKKLTYLNKLEKIDEQKLKSRVQKAFSGIRK